MNFDFWSFLAGAAVLLTIQHLSLIPWYRKHRVITALIQRAKMYQERAEKLAAANCWIDAEKSWKECRALLEQVKKLNK